MTLREAEAALAAERERAARLGAMLAARQQAAGERLAALERRVACLLGDADALAACTATELEALEQVCLLGSRSTICKSVQRFPVGKCTWGRCSQ